jgi:hypothetical protein
MMVANAATSVACSVLGQNAIALDGKKLTASISAGSKSESPAKAGLLSMGL